METAKNNHPDLLNVDPCGHRPNTTGFPSPSMKDSGARLNESWWRLYCDNIFALLSVYK